MAPHPPVWMLALIVGVAACDADAPRKRQQDEVCGGDDECVSSFCYTARCLQPAADDDADGLTNELERYLGSDPRSANSDGDDEDDLTESRFPDIASAPDSDLDGKLDIIESSLTSSDGDCIADELDSDDATPATDLAVVVAAICRVQGVCGAPEASVRLTVDPDACGAERPVLDQSFCDYTFVPGFQERERSCDGADNDCDGATDEPDHMILSACELTSELGTCVGSQVCEGGAVRCDGEPAAEEVCNGRDDDCDGVVDPVEVLCDDGDPCTVASCDVAAEACRYDAIAGCCGPEAVQCPPGYGCSAAGVCESDAAVYVPAGPFLMGCDLLDTPECPPVETPVVTINAGAFAMDRTEVTRAAYQICVASGFCAGFHPDCAPAPGEDVPATCVTWSNADAYCQWQGRRLCSEAEWEKAARGSDGRTYPWGEEAPSCALAVMADAAAADAACSGAGPQPVGSRPAGASAFGALDLAGNVWEWTADCWHDRYGQEQPADGSAWTSACDPGAGADVPPEDTRVVRGGGFGSSAAELRASARAAGAADDAVVTLGFRCCADVPTP